MLTNAQIIATTLADTGPVELHPQAKKLFLVHGFSILFALERMTKHPPGTRPWCDDSAQFTAACHALERMIGRDGRIRVVTRITTALQERGDLPLDR